MALLHAGGCPMMCSNSGRQSVFRLRPPRKSFPAATTAAGLRSHHWDPATREPFARQIQSCLTASGRLHVARPLASDACDTSALAGEGLDAKKDEAGWSEDRHGFEERQRQVTTAGGKPQFGRKHHEDDGCGGRRSRNDRRRPKGMDARSETRRMALTAGECTGGSRAGKGGDVLNPAQCLIHLPSP